MKYIEAKNIVSLEWARTLLSFSQNCTKIYTWHWIFYSSLITRQNIIDNFWVLLNSYDNKHTFFWTMCIFWRKFALLCRIKKSCDCTSYAPLKIWSGQLPPYWLLLWLHLFPPFLVIENKACVSISWLNTIYPFKKKAPQTKKEHVLCTISKSLIIFWKTKCSSWSKLSA